MRSRQRLKSSSLFYAVTFALLVGTLMASMVLLAHMRSVRSERYIAQGRVLDNARSAILHALGTMQADGTVHHLDLYGEGTDSITVQSIPYGGLEMVISEAWRSGQRASMTAYSGRLFDDGLVLRLSAKAGLLHLCGEARIEGDISVPRADVRRGYIEGKSFSGERLVMGNVLAAPAEHPTLQPWFLHRAEMLCTGGLPFHSTSDDLSMGQGRSKPLLPGDEIPELHFSNSTYLNGYVIEGPAVIRCDDSLFIGPDNRLSMVIIQAPSIRIGSGAVLSAQCFASHSIDVESGARLEFPSLLVVRRDDHAAEAPRMVLHDGSIVQGAVVLIDKGVRGRATGGCAIAKGARVEGEVYVQGGLQLQGQVQGTVTTQGFVLRTASSMYQDHLLDGTISRHIMHKPWGFGLCTSNTRPCILSWGPLRRSEHTG